MIGWVYVMTPTDYAHWLGGGEQGRVAWRRRRSDCFTQLGCITCHVADRHGPRAVAGRPLASR